MASPLCKSMQVISAYPCRRSVCMFVSRSKKTLRKNGFYLRKDGRLMVNLLHPPTPPRGPSRRTSASGSSDSSEFIAPDINDFPSEFLPPLPHEEAGFVEAGLQLLGLPSLDHLSEAERLTWENSNLAERLRPRKPNSDANTPAGLSVGTVPPHFQDGLTTTVRRGRGRKCSPQTQPKPKPVWEIMARVHGLARELKRPPPRKKPFKLNSHRKCLTSLVVAGHVGKCHVGTNQRLQTPTR